ncbi:hypothetical protein K7X08_023003 [Anisodus acutangulus]|uniref:Uncharacterized protein n=1 Tax=Anisodus acutangulus TaxID=402998 RepID=A0A9Q1MFF7_9SOLA|nr:hypothetical protein K7X08_023003 [Anisodus acutangulus]
MAAEEPSNYSTPKLPLSLSTPTMKLKYSSQHSTGILTPPLNTTLVSIPFKWEEQPGKPRPCTDLIISIFNDHKPKCLEPPPARLYYLENTKMPSPTTVLDGPYSNIERGQLGTLVLYNKNNKVRSSRGYWWHRFVKRRRVGGGNRKETGVGEGNFVFSSSSHVDSTNSSVKMARDRRNAKSNSHILASIYEGFKQVIPWKGKKSKKEVIIDIGTPPQAAMTIDLELQASFEFFLSHRMSSYN